MSVSFDEKIGVVVLAGDFFDEDDAVSAALSKAVVAYIDILRSLDGKHIHGNAHGDRVVAVEC